jgi:hypothetical protein
MSARTTTITTTSNTTAAVPRTRTSSSRASGKRSTHTSRSHGPPSMSLTRRAHSHSSRLPCCLLVSSGRPPSPLLPLCARLPYSPILVAPPHSGLPFAARASPTLRYHYPTCVAQHSSVQPVPSSPSVSRPIRSAGQVRSAPALAALDGPRLPLQRLSALPRRDRLLPRPDLRRALRRPVRERARRPCTKAARSHSARCGRRWLPPWRYSGRPRWRAQSVVQHGAFQSRVPPQLLPDLAGGPVVAARLPRRLRPRSVRRRGYALARLYSSCIVRLSCGAPRKCAPVMRCTA